jgi:hypothetical protein
MPVVANRKLESRPMTGLLPAKWDDRATFNVAEAAEIIGISTRSCWEAVWKGAQNGGLHSVKIGGRVIIPRQALERLLTVA